MNIYLDKKINCESNNIKMVFALCYAFCGYTLLYGSCFMPWMDIVALFPLLMIAYDTMIQKGKKRLYIDDCLVIYYQLLHKCYGCYLYFSCKRTLFSIYM